MSQNYSSKQNSITCLFTNTNRVPRFLFYAKSCRREIIKQCHSVCYSCMFNPFTTTNIRLQRRDWQLGGEDHIWDWSSSMSNRFIVFKALFQIKQRTHEIRNFSRSFLFIADYVSHTKLFSHQYLITFLSIDLHIWWPILIKLTPEINYFNDVWDLLSHHW